LTDPVLLARIQFAANMSFHILFPTITIALGWRCRAGPTTARRSTGCSCAATACTAAAA
jgi:hypothetical protein